MTISMFETRTMLESIEQMHVPKTFLLDMFFKGENVANTKHVDIDIIKGKRRLAAFVQPTAEGKVIERTGYTSNSIIPPYIKQKMPFSAQDLLKRERGDTIYQGNASPAQRAQMALGKDLLELMQMTTRREEWMAAQALNTGIVPVVGDGIDAQVDFNMGATHKITLSGGALWSATTSTPLANLRAWKKVVAKDSGLVPDVAVFGSDVLDAFLAHADVQKQLDTRRITMGQIDPTTLPNGASYVGRIEELDIYTYDEYYLDDSDVLQPMVPVDKIWLGSTRAQTTRQYGAIQDLEATAVVKYFPKAWITKDPSVQWVMLQSAPIVCPNQIDAFLSAKAV